MSTMNDDTYLIHTGRKGMKWGMHIFGRKSNSSGGKRRGKISSFVRKTKKQINKSNNLSKMSDEELRKRINRLNLEKQYKDLNKSTVNTGRKAVNEILVSSVRSVAKEATRTAIGTTLNSVTGMELINTSKKKDKK